MGQQDKLLQQADARNLETLATKGMGRNTHSWPMQGRFMVDPWSIHG
jgi:hypothetical protein